MLEIIFPILGSILTNFFGINIFKSYLLNRNKLNYEYNEILFYLIFFNAIGWTIYGSVIKDIFIFTSSLTSLISSFGFIQIIYKYIKPEKLIYIEVISIIYYLYFITIMGLINFTNININEIVGISCIISTISVNFAPLLIIKQVIKTNKTDLIYLPQAFINFTNYLCWFIYSIINYNIYLFISNIVTLSLCLLQIIVFFYVRTKKKDNIIVINLV